VTIDFLKEYAIFQNETLQNLTLLENQGFCNTNYLLRTSKNKYVIRVFKNNINRKFEFDTQQKVHQKGIAPKPLLLDLQHSLMIYQFVEGLHKVKLKKHHLRALATLLNRLHKTKVRGSFPKDFVLCHHDLNPLNILFSHTITLIDWEYARINNRYFDLATIAVEYNLTLKEEAYFLYAYFKNHAAGKEMYDYKINYLQECIAWFSDENNEKEKLGYIKKLNSLKKSTQQSLQGGF
jgi:thiamine kinase-like enzyme